MQPLLMLFQMRTIYFITASLALCLLCIFSGAINWIFQFILIAAIYFLHGGFSASRRWSRLQTLILVLPFVLIYDITWIFIGSLSSLPIAVIPYITFTTGYLLNRKTYGKSVYINTLCVMLIISAGIFFMQNWLSYASNRKAYESYKFPELNFYYQNGDKFNIKDFRGKVILLDFWYKSCSVCIKQFPEIDEFSKSLDTTLVKLFVVNLPVYDTLNERKILDNMSYSFTKLNVGKTIAECKDSLRIYQAPVILVISPDGQVVYNGSFVTEKYILVNNIQRITRKTQDRSYLSHDAAIP
jgi:thiol-disulfide isomerase/thioredoxin